MASESKTLRLIQKIGTHNGVFHCDEALACFMLTRLPEYRDAEIVRSRDLSVNIARTVIGFLIDDLI